MKKKQIAVILLIVLILPITLYLKPVFAEDVPQITAKLDVSGNKQVITLNWKVPEDKWWGNTSDKVYTVMSRSKLPDGTYTDWSPVTQKGTSRTLTITEPTGNYEIEPNESEYGNTFEYCLSTDQLQAGQTAADINEVSLRTEPVTTKKAAEIPSGDSKTDDSEEFWDKKEDKGNIFERIVALLAFFPVKGVKFVGELAEFKEINKLVFLEGQNRDNLPWNSPEQKKKIYQWFYFLMWSMLPLYVLVIAYNGFKLMYTANNPMTRKEAIESIQRWFLSLGIIIFAPIFIDLIMTISGIIIDAIVYAFNGISGDGTSINLMERKIATGTILGTAIIKVMFAFMYLYFNVIYIVRMVAISVMFAFTPLMAIMWAIKKDVTAVAVWMGELASNAFMPVAHGLVLCTILLLCKKESEPGSWVQILIMLYCLVPLSEALRNSMMSVFTRASGINEQRVGMNALGTIMGLGGLVSMARVGKATFGDKGFSSGGEKMSLSKGVSKPQNIPNLNRQKPPRDANAQTGFGQTAGGRFQGFSFSNQSPQYTPQPNFNKLSYGKANGKSMYAKHNWDHKTPKPTAVKKPLPVSGKPRTFQYEQPENNLHRSTALNKALPAASFATKAMMAPMVMMAGAVPGGAGMVAGAYAATNAVNRGLFTAGTMGHNIQMARKENGGNTAQAMQRVTGATTTAGAARSVASTIGGSIINPNKTLNRAIQEKKFMDQSQNTELRAKKARLDARKNPVQFNKQNRPPGPKTNQSRSNRNYNFTGQTNQRTNGRTAPPGQKSGTTNPKTSNPNKRVYSTQTRPSTGNGKEYTRQQYKNMRPRRTITPNKP